MDGAIPVEVKAGTQPGEHIHQEVADVLEKLGLDTSREHPKLLTRDTIAASTSRTAAWIISGSPITMRSSPLQAAPPQGAP